MISVKTKENLKALTDKSTVLLDLGALWCGPCLKLTPVITDIENSGEFNNITFAKVDIDESPELAVDYSIMSVPTLLFIKNGKVIDTQIGYVNKSTLKSWIVKNNA